MSATSPAIKTLACLYGAAFIALAMLDALWLGVIARPFYRREMGALLSESVRMGPALLFYALYPVGLIYLAVLPGGASLQYVALRCAALGLLVYGTYDLTNMATLRGWSLQLSVVDSLWGTFVSAAAGTAAWWAVLGRAS